MMKRISLLLLLLLLFCCASFERFPFVSTMIKEQVTVQVALPNSYNHSTDFKYPALVVLDGSTQFEHISAGVQFLSLASEPDEMKSAFDAMLDSLNKNTPDKLVWFHAQFPNETHDSTPLIGNNKALEAIFSGWNAVPEINVMSLAELQKFYQSKRFEFGYEFPMSEHQYNVYGLKTSYEGKTDLGVEILEQGYVF